MLKKQFLLAFMLLYAGYAGAQAVTDPMITKWWFNTTNNKYTSILTDV